MSAILEKMSARAAKWLVTKPRQVAVMLAVTLVVSLALMPTLKLESGTHIFLADDEPAVAFLEEVEKEFVSDDVIIVAYKTDDPFSHRSLTEVRALGLELEAIERVAADGTNGGGLVDDVLSLTSVKDLRGGDGTFRSELLVPDDIPTDANALKVIAERAHNNELIRDNLLSTKSPQLSVLMVRMVREVTESERKHIVEEVRRMVDEAEKANGGSTTFYVTGTPVGGVDTVTYMQRDLIRFVPVTYLLLCGLMYFFTRRLLGVLLAFVNATIAVIFGMGTLAVFGSLTNLSTIMPPMLMVLSVATVVHFYTEYARNTHVVGKAMAAEVTLRELIVPAFMCELTTAVGFLSFAFNRTPAMREFGVAACIAVMGAFALSFLLLGLAVQWLGAEKLISSNGIATSQRIENAVDTYSDWAIKKPKTVLVLMGLLTVVSAIGLYWFRVDHSTLNQFKGDVPIRIATDVVNEALGGVSELVVSIRTKDENRFLDPNELKKLQGLQQFLVSDVKATTTTAITDSVKLMNRAMNDDDNGFNRVPDSREQVAQLVLLNGDDRVFQFVDRNWQWARVVARTPEEGSYTLGKRFDQIRDYLKVNFPAAQGYDAQVTGSTYLEVVMANNTLDGQTTSFLWSFVLIFVPIVLVFGSVKAALFAMPSNLFPIFACLGLMGWVGMPLDMATSMTTSIVLGIAVDDTIHFIQTMRKSLEEHSDIERAIRHTMATKGVGALWITLIITLGFAALTASSFAPTFNFGLITAFAMLAGVAAEVLLLPPLIVLTKTRLGVPLPTATPSAEPLVKLGAT